MGKSVTWKDIDEIDDDDEEIEQEYCPEREKEINKLAETFYEDVAVLAKQYIEQFFKDKMLYCGGKIPKSFLLSEESISKVLNYDIIKGVDEAYSALEKTICPEEIMQAQQTGETSSDIKLVNETFNLLARSGVPQQFAGGMMCLYLKFVEGIEFD